MFQKFWYIETFFAKAEGILDSMFCAWKMNNIMCESYVASGRINVQTPAIHGVFNRFPGAKRSGETSMAHPIKARLL